MRCAGEAVHHAVPDSGFHPASEAIVAGDVGGHSAVAPHAKEHPIAEPRKCRSARDGHQHEAPSRLVGQQRLNHAPLVVGQIVSAHDRTESDVERSWKMYSIAA